MSPRKYQGADPKLGVAPPRHPITGELLHKPKSRKVVPPSPDETAEQRKTREDKAAEVRLESAIEDERNSPSAMGYVEENDFEPYEGLWE